MRFPARSLVYVCLAAATLFFSGLRVTTAKAQDPPGIVTPLNDTGIHPFSAYDGAHENISTSNGNLNIYLPLVSFPQRSGKSFDLAVEYDSKVWSLQFFNNFDGTYDTFWQQDTRVPMIAPNWRLAVPTLEATASPYRQCTTYSVHDWVFTEANGSKHHFTAWRACTPSTGGNVFIAYSDDTAFFKIDITNQPDIVVYSRDGTAYHFKDFQGNNYKAAFDTIVDTNGNVLQTTKTTGSSTGNAITAITDTVGRTFNVDLTNHALSYKDPNGTTRTISFTQLAGGTGNAITFNHPVNAECGFAGGASSLSLGNQNTSWKLTIPDGGAGLSYQFTYDAASELIQVNYPSGGYTKYDYAAYASKFSSHTFNCTNVDFREVIAKHECRRSDGNCGPSPAPTPEDTTTYTAVAGNRTNASMDVFRPDPSGTPNKTHYQFSTPGFPDYIAVETSRSVYSGSSTLLRTITTDYNLLTNGSQMVVRDQSLPIRATTTLNDITPSLTSKVETDYDTLVAGGFFDGNPTEVREYDFGLTLVRKTDNTWLKTTAYTNKNILDRKLTAIVKTGAGTQIALTTYEYDNYTEGLTASGATQHQTTDNNRGNLTATTRWLNTTNSNLPPTRNQYDDAGNIRKIADPLLHSTLYSFSDSWQDSSCAPVTGQAAAYPTSITNALGQITTRKYFSCSGQLGKETDPNLLSMTYAYDLLGRRSSTIRPDAGTTTWTYNDVAPISVTQNAQINQNQSPALAAVTTVVTDGLGRPIQRQLTSDPQGTVYTDQTYDSLGRVASLSNPYRTGTDATTSLGTTTFAYDPLNRKKLETYPDGSVLTTAYCGASTLVTDPTLKWRRSRTDGLGRLIEVDEPNAPGATVAPTGCPGTGEPLWITSYSYNVLGNLTQVVQNGSRQRNFTYDSLSHLLTAANPETGTITYAYNSDGILTSKTDARSILTNYNPASNLIDALHRVTGITYSNGDPSVTVAYDQANCLGLSSCQNIGHRTSMTDAAGSESWAFQVDASNFRSIHKEQRTTNSITKSATYFLDLASNVTQAIYPTSRTVNYTYDAANRPSKATDASNGITYAAGFQTPPSSTNCVATAVCYTPQGTFYALSIGQSSTFTGLNLKHTYNSRLQPSEFSAASSVGNAIDISYNFLDASNHNSGHAYGINNNLDGTRSQTFTYDQLNRITGAQTTSTFATSSAHCWSEVYTIDPWANLQSIAATSNPNYTGCVQESGFTAAPDGNNHLGGFGYDLSGNTTNDGVNAYTWNAESQMRTAAGVTYTYDGDGRRAQKSSGKLYWYGSGGEILAETDAAGVTQNEYIFFGSQRIAMLPAGGNPLYYVEDLLGTSRIITQSNGTVCYDADFYPYGGERTAYVNTCPQNYKFEGKERDSETGNDDFGARYYSNRFGRWLSADWSAIPAPVPYANLTIPQTLNLYAMIADDPESFADLDGHGVECTNLPGPCQQSPAQATGQDNQQQQNQKAQASQSPPNANTVIAAIYRFGDYLAALGAVGNAAQSVSDKSEVTAQAQVGNGQIDTHGETSIVAGPPALAVGVTATINKPGPDQTVIAQPGVALTPVVQISTNVVRDPDGKVHQQGTSVTLQLSTPTPKQLPISVAVPSSAFSRIASAVENFLGMGPTQRAPVDPSNGGTVWY